MNEPTAGGQTPSEPVPLFRVVRGRPSDEQTAALTVVLVAARAARARAGRAGGSGGHSHWASRQRALGVPLAPGPHAWRRSVR